MFLRALRGRKHKLAIAKTKTIRCFPHFPVLWSSPSRAACALVLVLPCRVGGRISCLPVQGSSWNAEQAPSPSKLEFRRLEHSRLPHRGSRKSRISRSKSRVSRRLSLTQKAGTVFGDPGQDRWVVRGELAFASATRIAARDCVEIKQAAACIVARRRRHNLPAQFGLGRPADMPEIQICVLFMTWNG